MAAMLMRLLLLLLAGCVAQVNSVHEQAGAEYRDSSPLVFEPAQVDMGTVKEGEPAVSYLRLRNSGDRMLQIASVTASCGCTAVEPEERLLMPGAFTRLQVKIDTFAKQEGVRKWVQVTDSNGGTSRAWLTLKVVPNPHLAGSKRSIFDKPCATCHYDPARGKRSGAAIYRAVCSMCHGKQGQGGYAPRLAGHNDAALLGRLIADGTGGHYMPGFLRANGGPLDRAQIDALARWIVSLDD